METTTVRATISGTYGWTPGRGVLATLRTSPTSADAGYSRQEVEGTPDEFAAAIAAATAARSTAYGPHKMALTRLIQRMSAALRWHEETQVTR